MGSFSYADKLLLGVLLPLWLVFLGFHIKEINRTGFAAPPIYAAASAESMGYPTIGGFPLERGRGDGALEVGDVLIRVGDTELRGVGYLGFDAIALEEAGTSLETVVVFERGVTGEAPRSRCSPRASATTARSHAEAVARL